MVSSLLRDDKRTRLIITIVLLTSELSMNIVDTIIIPSLLNLAGELDINITVTTFVIAARACGHAAGFLFCE